MGIAARAMDFGAPHEQCVVRLDADVTFGDRLKETRPAHAGLEFGVRTEQFQVARNAAIDARLMVVPIRACKRALGPALARDAVLFRSEELLPFRVGLRDFFDGHIGWRVLSC